MYWFPWKKYVSLDPATGTAARLGFDPPPRTATTLPRGSTPSGIVAYKMLPFFSKVAITCWPPSLRTIQSANSLATSLFLAFLPTRR